MPLTTPLKKRPTLFSQKIFVSKNKTKQNKQKKNKWLLENRILIFNTPKTSTKKWKRFFLSIKTRTKWDEIMIVIFQEKKIKKWRIFFCVCACCVLTKFFLILAPGLEPPLFWLKNNPFVIPMFRLHFFIHPTKN